MTGKVEDLIKAGKESARRHQRMIDAARATSAGIAGTAPTPVAMPAGGQQSTGSYGGGQQ